MSERWLASALPQQHHIQVQFCIKNKKQNLDSCHFMVPNLKMVLCVKKKKKEFRTFMFETMLVKCQVYSSCKNFQRKQSRKLICINFEVSTIGWEIQLLYLVQNRRHLKIHHSSTYEFYEQKTYPTGR